MPLDWSPGADAVYRQIAAMLRAAIEADEYAPGQLLPSEASLCQTYGVSRDTVRDALGVLRAEGAVVTVRGFGTYVRGTVEPRTVTVPSDAKVTARMPTDRERRTLALPEGVPVVVVARPGEPDQVLPGDSTVIVPKGS